MSRSRLVLTLALAASVVAPSVASAGGLGGGGLRAAPQMRFEQVHQSQLRLVPRYEQTKPLAWRTDCYWTQKKHPHGQPVRICP